MEGVGGELINVESTTVNELTGDLAKAHKSIEEREADLEVQKRLLMEKETEVKRLLEKIALLELENRQSEGGTDDSEPEVKLEILERKAEEIIPKECWEAVLRNLNSEDLLSCRQVCKIFSKLLDLKEFKEKWSFLLILPQLSPYLKTSGPNGKPSWKHFYNARLVCRSWRQSIDKYASEVRGTRFTFFQTTEDIEDFQQRFGECSTNPFPSRSVSIRNQDDEWVDESEDHCKAVKVAKTQQHACIQKVGDLLEHFGKHIFTLQLWFHWYWISYPDPLTLYKLIRRITIHLPNLKELIIGFASKDEPDDDDEVKGLASYVAENALVALPKLQGLTMFGLDKKVVAYLLDAYGPQLTETEMPFSKELSTQFQMRQLKNVRKLRLRLGHPNYTLESLRFLKSPLELLDLACDFEYAEERWNVDEVLCNLKHLPIELLQINFVFSGLVNMAEAGIDIEDYKNTSIKTLIIQIYPIYDATCHHTSFNFLQALTKLEKLEVKVPRGLLRTTHPEELPEVVELNEYLFGEEETDSLYYSNVWEKVPSLKTLTLIRREENEFVNPIFTREQYERFIRIIPEWFP